jgi:hypothetical protein
MCLPLPAQLQPRQTLHQRGERDGVTGSTGRGPLGDRAGMAGTFRAKSVGLPLTLPLSPQAGRGDSRGACGGAGGMPLGAP